MAEITEITINLNVNCEKIDDVLNKIKEIDNVCNNKKTSQNSKSTFSQDLILNSDDKLLIKSLKRVPGLDILVGLVQGAAELGGSIGIGINEIRKFIEDNTLRTSALDEPLSKNRRLASQEKSRRLKEQKRKDQFGLNAEELVELEILKQQIGEFEFPKIPELDVFSDELIKKYLDIIKHNDNLNQSLEKSSKSLENQTDSTIKNNQEKQQSINLLQKNNQSLLDTGDTQSTLAIANKEVTENLKEQNVQVEQANETLENFGGTTEDVTDKTESLDKEVINQAGNLEVYEGTLEQTDQAAQQLGENGLPKAAEGAEQFGETIENLDDSGGIFDDLKKGTEDFFNSLQTTGELTANFITDTFGQIRNTISDLFFNVLKGNFDDLGDIAKQAFNSILNSFLQLVSNIAANKLVVSIGGLFGLGSSAAAAGGAGAGGGFQDIVGAGLGGLGAALGGSFGALGSLFGIGAPLTQTALLPAGGLPFFLPTQVPIGFLGTLGAALPAIGAIIAAVAIAIPLISGFLKKKPKVDIDIGVIKEDIDGEIVKRGAAVQEFLDALDAPNSDLARQIVQFSTVQGGVGIKGKVREDVRKAILTVIGGTIEGIQSIINQLPSDLAQQLNEALLSTEVDFSDFIGLTKNGGDQKLLEFESKSKDAAEKLQDFIEGDLSGRFIFAIRDFFVIAFESLGALPDAAQSFVDAEFEKFLDAGSAEERKEIAEGLLLDFQTITDAFNLIEGFAPDTLALAVNEVKNLSDTLGFDAVPSIGELDNQIRELISAAEFDPDVIQDFLDLRTAILQLQTAILGSISSIISNISSLNSIIVGAGGSAFDLQPFINEGLDSVIGLLGQEGLSTEDQEALLGLGTGFLDQLLAEEQAAFQAQLEAAQKAAEAAAEAQREVIRAQISGLEEERDLIEENFDKRLEALEEELRIAEEFARLTESIQQTLDSIILGPDSVFTAVERLNIVQGDIASLQSELAATTDPQKQLEMAEKLEGSLETLFDLAGEAFGVNSPEFVAIFDQVTGGLNDLIDLTGNRERSVEEINAEIEALNIERNQQLEAIDAQIESLNERLSSIQAQNVDATFQASDRVQELAEFFRNEYITLLEERFAQLEEVSDSGFTEELDALNSLDANFSEFKEIAAESLTIEDSMLIELRNINATLGGVPGFMGGSGGIQNFGNGTLALLHGNEAVLTVEQINDLINNAGVKIGDNVGSPLSLISSLTDVLFEKLDSRLGPSSPLQLGGFVDLFSSGKFTNFLGDVGSNSNDNQGVVDELAIKLDVNINSNSQGTVDAAVVNIEDMLVRSIRQGGKLRSAVQEAGARRLS